MNAYKLMKEATLIDLKENISKNMPFYELNSNDEFLKILQIPNIDQNLILEVSDPSNRSKEDLINAINLYEYYNELPLTLASDERFWSYLTHTSFWAYMCKRWPVQAAEGDEVEFIKTRYFFSSKSKTFYRNGLSRLWWYVNMTYDKTKDDPYFYTRIILGYQDVANLLIETTNLSRNNVALKAILEIISNIDELEKSGDIQKIKNKRQLVRDLIKYINLVGGVTIWDMLNEKEAYDKAWRFIEGQVKYTKVEQLT
ncbi:DUF6339 family protein [Neobacillus sp. PS2-9]|uniref:DUF6339 family protein n=1 Tax=Neobacillus sp. PS2-9 TaxID=3070676 RepID=UPI0027DF18D1|nr:DUF6339 family protein [Neobacillus sp. PS2-9]WML57754.1 DUF6339 family protein [Neobacillus sp. PS2-9]